MLCKCWVPVAGMICSNSLGELTTGVGKAPYAAGCSSSAGGGRGRYPAIPCVSGGSGSFWERTYGRESSNPAVLILLVTDMSTSLFLWPSRITTTSWWKRKAVPLVISLLCTCRSPLSTASSSSAGIASDEECASVATTVEGHSPRLLSLYISQFLNSIRRDPCAAFSFFHDLADDGFCHDASTFAVMVWILCRARLEKKLIAVFCDLIRSNQGSISAILDVFSVLSETWNVQAEGTAVPLLHSALSGLVKAYAELQMPEEAAHAFSELGSRRILANTNTCNFLMNCLIEAGNVKRARTVYNQMRCFSINPNCHTFAILIKAMGQTADLEKVSELFDEMQEAGVEPDGFIHKTYIDLLCSNGKPELGYEWLKAVRQDGIFFDAFGYNRVMRGLCKDKRLDKAEKVLQEMLVVGVTPDVNSYSYIIRGHCEYESTTRALFLYDEMRSHNIKPNKYILSSILHRFHEMGSPALALDWFNNFRDSGFFLDEVLYNIAIAAHCKLGDLDQALAVFHEMKERQLSSDVFHFTTLIDGYCRKGKVLHAWKMFANMEKIGIEPDLVMFNVLAAGSCRSGLVDETLKLVDHMRNCGFEPNSTTYSIQIEALCKRGDLKEAERLYRSLIKRAVVKDEAIPTAMVLGYLEIGQIEDAMRTFISSYEKGSLVREPACSELLSKLCEKGDLRMAEMVLSKMSMEGVYPDEYSCCQLVDAFSRNGEMRKAHNLFQDFIAIGLEPKTTLIMYTTLINGYCKFNRLEEADLLVSEMKEKNIAPDEVTNTVLMNINMKAKSQKGGWNCTKDQDQIITRNKELWHGMISLDIKPDVVCRTIQINALVRTGHIHNARRLFKNMKKMGLIPDGVSFKSLLSSAHGLDDVEKANEP